jgi:hypothetical protein
MLRKLLPSTLIILSILLSGCANKVTSNQNKIEPYIADQTEEDSGNSERALIEAETQYDEALQADIEFYSPLTIQKAQEFLKLAQVKELNADKKSSLKASTNVLLLLESAKKNKEKVEHLLKKIFSQKKILDNLKTPRILTAEYNAQISNIKNIIQKIENNEQAEALKVSDKIYSELQTLELNTLLAIHWSPAKKTLQKAKEEGAINFANKSFLLASDAVNNAETLIRSDYKNHSKVEINGTTALRAAQKALYTARDAKYLIGLNQEQAEGVVLRFQDLIAKIGTALKSKDLRHMGLEDQANALAQVAETQGSRLTASLNEKIADLEEQLSQLKIQQDILIKEETISEEAIIE